MVAPLAGRRRSSCVQWWWWRKRRWGGMMGVGRVDGGGGGLRLSPLQQHCGGGWPPPIDGTPPHPGIVRGIPTSTGWRRGGEGRADRRAHEHAFRFEETVIRRQGKKKYPGPPPLSPSLLILLLILVGRPWEGGGWLTAGTLDRQWQRKETQANFTHIRTQSCCSRQSLRLASLCSLI